MADLDGIILNDTNYAIKDSTARASISNLATVATSGNYNDLSNKPSINGVPLSGNKTPAELGIGVDDALSTSSENAVQNKVVTNALATKAEKDSTSPDLISGNMMSDVYAEDSVPYLFRQSGGGVRVGTKEEDEIVGGSIAWNQLIQNGNFESVAGWSKNRLSLTASNNIGVALVTNTQYNTVNIYQAMNIVGGHKYFITADILPKSTNVTNLQIGGGSANKTVSNPSTTSWNTVESILNPTNATYMGFTVNFSAIALNDEIDFRNIMLCDLTQMFGSTVADYIYALETATTGAGVAYFRSLFPKPYYAYNAGTLMHVSGLTSHDMVGFNQWDEEWQNGRWAGNNGVLNTAFSTYVASKNKIPVLPNTTYYFEIGNPTAKTHEMVWYDADEKWIGEAVSVYQSAAFTTPSNCYYMTFNLGGAYGATYNNDICINLSSSRNGEYEPYHKNTYALDSTLTLRGIPKVANSKMYFDGDTYTSDGTVTRKYGYVDLGTLSWSKSSSGNKFYARLSPLYPKGQNVQMRCSTYMFDGYGSSSVGYYGADKTFRYNATEAPVDVTCEIYFHDESYTSASAFATAVNGVYLVYELYVPTTETATGFTNPQEVDADGTEEYVITTSADVAVPVGHVTKYPSNQKQKLDGLPWDFSTLIAPTETEMKATRAYSANDFIIVNNQLYKVTASIASGANLTVGTNVTAVTVADILTALLNA